MSSAPDERPKPGRRRDPTRDTAIADATLAVFVEEGYSALTIEGVAARAGVGKATIYRRYASKAELVVDAVRAGAGIADGLPDTGDVRADLATMLRPLLTKLKSIPEGSGTMLDNTLVLFVSDMGLQNAHCMEDIPVVLAGKAGGALTPGKYILNHAPTPACGPLVDTSEE